MALSHRGTSGPFDIAASVAALTLATAACYEVLAAAGVLEIGNEPGEGTAGEIVVSVAAAIGFLIAAATLALAASRGRAPRALAFVVLPLAAAAYMVARFYAYDPYYDQAFDVHPRMGSYRTGGSSGSPWRHVPRRSWCVSRGDSV